MDLRQVDCIRPDPSAVHVRSHDVTSIRERMMVEFLLFSVGVNQASEQLFENAVMRFIKTIEISSIGIEGRVVKPDRQLIEVFNEICEREQDFASVTACICEHFVYAPSWNGSRIPKVVIACQKNSRLARLVQGSNSLAKWGGSNGAVAIIYHFEPALIWHEMFHLLGAKDCYNVGADERVEDDRTCGNESCVMQYAPNIATVGDPPFLCSGNINEIQKVWRTAIE